MLNRDSYFSKISKFIVDAFPHCRLVLLLRLLREWLSSLRLRVFDSYVYRVVMSVIIISIIITVMLIIRSKFI